MDQFAATTQLIRKDFNLSLSETDEVDTLTEAQLLRLLADEVDRMMGRNLDRLLSLLYTMDVGEADVAQALHPASPVPPNEALARLIYERQRRRIHTKATLKPKPLEDEDLAW